MKYYLFGSENSLDYDILVEYDSIPKELDKAHAICKKFNEQLSLIYLDKKINSNLITIKDNQIVNCHKGINDELNNCLFYTYHLHQQKFSNPILEPVERDLNEKILRVARFIITFYSRTELRKEIKAALRGNLHQKLAVLEKIDFTKMTEFIGKKEKPEDVWKIIAFQFGQVFSLFWNFEKDSYTKNGIIKNLSELSNILNRGTLTEKDFKILNHYLSLFINAIYTEIKYSNKVGIKFRLEETKKDI
jgi:hypothetical protein